MAMLVASWSSMGKFCGPLAVRHILCPFLGGQLPLSSATKSTSGEGTCKDCWSIQHSTSACSNLQKTASTVFCTLDPLSMTEFIVTCLKGAEHRDWMQSRRSLRRAIVTIDLSLPGLVDVVSNKIGVWRLIVSYLKETGKKDKGDSFVAGLFLVFSINMIATAYFRFHF